MTHLSALATDFDGTLAREGVVDQEVINTLADFRASGRRVMLVTGRTMPSLFHVFPKVDAFDLVVAENGATLYDPRKKLEKPLAQAPSSRFTSVLTERGVAVLETGRVIVSTTAVHHDAVAAAIRDLQLALRIVMNRESLMVLPEGVSKATGLQAAAAELGLNLSEIAGIGDAENDQAFLSACELSAAVQNALPELKRHVKLVTRNAYGAGVVEFISHIAAQDLSGQFRK